jgi:hypothetical protein
VEDVATAGVPSLDSLRSHGSQIVRGLIEPEVIETVHRFLSSSIADADAILGKAGLSVSDPEFGARTADISEPDLPPDVASVLLGHFPLETRLSRVLWSIARLPDVQELMRTVLDSEPLFMHLPPTARYVLPHNRRAAVPPHQDVSYNRHMADFAIMWVPLVSIDEHCGGVAVYDGSHLGGEQQRGADGAGWLGATRTDGLQRSVCAPMEPGDVLLLDRWIIHESVANESPDTRISVDYRFFGGPPKSDKHYLDFQTMEVIEPGSQAP